MPYHSSKLFLRRYKIILLFCFLGLFISIIASFAQPFQYASTIRLLVLQDVVAVDAYTASRSVERLAENFSTIIFTTAFFDDVLNAGFDIDKGYFPSREDRKRKTWGRMVSATVSRGTGLLTIRVYHPNVLQAEQIASAIIYVLERDVNIYAPGSQASIRLADAALNSRWPMKPNFLANGVSGLVLGGLIGVGYISLQAERIKRRHQVG